MPLKKDEDTKKDEDRKERLVKPGDAKPEGFKIGEPQGGPQGIPQRPASGSPALSTQGARELRGDEVPRPPDVMNSDLAHEHEDSLERDKRRREKEGEAGDTPPIAAPNVKPTRRPEDAWQDHVIQAAQGTYPRLRVGVDYAVGRKDVNSEPELLETAEGIDVDWGKIREAAEKLASADPSTNYKPRPSLHSGYAPVGYGGEAMPRDSEGRVAKAPGHDSTVAHGIEAADDDEDSQRRQP